MTQIKLDLSTDVKGNEIAHFENKGIHLTVRPHIIAEDDGTLKDYGLEVEFWGDKEGKMDPDQLLEVNIIPGTREDIEEVTDMYARRLEGGIKPEDMFEDVIEKNRETNERPDEDIKTS